MTNCLADRVFLVSLVAALTALASVGNAVAAATLADLPSKVPVANKNATGEDATASGHVGAQGPLRLENERIGLSFDRKTGTLTAIENRLAKETYQVRGDQCAVQTTESYLAFADLKLASLDCRSDVVKVRYEGEGMTAEVTYTLCGENHFIEKQLTLVCDHPYGLKRVVVSHPTFSAPGLRIVPYRYPNFQRAPGAEAECTFFGRTARGGFFTGLEVSFDASSAQGDNVLLQFAPSLKVAAGEEVTCEPAYFGVYRRRPHDEEKEGLPLQSESDAMVAMTSAILGPPRFGLVPMVNGWGSGMEKAAYTEQTLASDMKALDVIAQCGIDWYCDAHPWAGETAKMNALGPNDKCEPSPLAQRFLEHSRKVGVKVVMFSTMNNSYPWMGGRPFRADRPDWLLDARAHAPAPAPDWRKTTAGVLSAGGNCLGSRDFAKWLEQVNLEAIANGPYPGWCVDGDFFGGGGLYTTVVPVDCQSDKHNHLPGDSDYACQRALTQLVASIREHYPQTYISMYRPPMDLGVWSLRNVDVCFTFYESGTVADNLAAGDSIRTWSRARVHHNFFPHYIDQPLLFSPAESGQWPQGHFDYILLSALSSSPNQLYYLPVKSHFPEGDKAEIKKWLAWGRKNVKYLLVRKDLPDWPAADKVDGSAHIVGDQGLVFLFNPSQKTLTGQFALTEESIGLSGAGDFQVSQEYPAVDRKTTSAAGQTVRWEVSPTTPVVLRVQPAVQ